MLVKDVRSGSGAQPRRAGLVVMAVLVAVGLSACSSDNRSTQEAYRIGCPALDAAVAGSGTVKHATIKGLEIIRDSGQLDPQPQDWLEIAIKGLSAASPQDLPGTARKTLVGGCADHGYELTNLS